MKPWAHIATIGAMLAVFLGIPAGLHVDIASLISGDADTVSSASIIQDAPSGRYEIFINRRLHADDEVLAEWVRFFEGEDVGLIWEDISCVAVEGDAGGIEMAGSLQSRLPENQMQVRIENGILAVSKAEAGRFDILIMSAEAAESLDAGTLSNLDYVVEVMR